MLSLLALQVFCCFNPHPIRRSDAMCRAVARLCSAIIVSILIRSEDRMQFCCSGVNARHWSGFNPHPIRRSDAIIRLVSSRTLLKFQSSSDPKIGCNVVVSILAFVSSLVSILIRSEDRMQLIVDIATAIQTMFQSSSDPKIGCNPELVFWQLHDGEFQSSSDPKIGCNKRLSVPPNRHRQFQSSSDPKIGCNRPL